MDDQNPTADQIKRQLRLLLDSRMFRNATSQAKLLKHVVDKSLEGETLTEDEIGLDIFRGYKQGISDDVRVAATNLRKSLPKYYAGQGMHDPVIVHLPPGRGYKPSYSYNPKADAVTNYLRAKSFLPTFSWVKIFMATSWLDRACTSGYFAPAFSERANLRLERHLIDSAFSPDPYSEETMQRIASDIDESIRDASTAIEIDKGYWHGHYILGALLTLKRRWVEAESCFAKALGLNEHETTHHAWYPAFLLAKGHPDEALRMISKAAGDNPTDPRIMLTLLLFFYLTRHHEEVDRLYREDVLPGHGISLISRFIIALNYFAINDLDGAEDQLFAVPGRYEPVEDYSEYALRQVAPGMLALLQARKGDRKGAEKIVKDMLEPFAGRPGTKPEQIAIGYMALDQPHEAIAQLKPVMEPCNLFMLWIEYWPIFDPLREMPEFKRLTFLAKHS